MMENQAYEQEIMPLITQLDQLAVKYNLPFMLVVETSMSDFRLSAYIPSQASHQMRDSYKWWEEDTRS